MKILIILKFCTKYHNHLAVKGTAHATSAATNLSSMTIQTNRTAPAATDKVQKGIVEAKEGEFVAVSDDVETFAKAVVPVGD